MSETSAAPAGPSADAAARCQPPKEKPALYPLLHELARALPPLWKKAHNKHLTAREQHKKMLDLIIWLVTKQGLIAKQRFPIQYWHSGIKKDGKVDLSVEKMTGEVVLHLELDWSKNAASIHKLQSSSIHRIPVLLISGITCETKAEARLLRTFANESTGKSTNWWLPLFHLEHRWI